MANLSKSSAGTWVNADGGRAVAITRQALKLADGWKAFEFHATPSGGKTRVEWQGDIAVVPADIADLMVARRYAVDATDEQAKSWNGAVSRAKGKADTAPAAPAVPTAPAAPAADADHGERAKGGRARKAADPA